MSDGSRRLGRPRKGERGDTRQDLLDAALALFADQGYASTSVKQIAAAVGVRDSAIYSHFSGKREIFDRLVERSGPDLLDEIGIRVEELGAQHPQEVLPELFERLVEAWDQPTPRRMISMLMREGLPGVAEVLEGIQVRFRKPVQQWQVRGWIRDDIAIEQLVRELIIPMGAVRLLYLNSGADSEARKRGRELARRHIEYFLTTAAVPQSGGGATSTKSS